MRFVFAIVTFMVAAALIGLSIAQRTVWEAPNTLTATATVTDDAPFIVISGKVLNSHPGQQTLFVSGSKHVFVAYGRTADVKAWVGDSPHTRLSYDSIDNKLTSKAIEPKVPVETATPDPSDTSAPQTTPTTTTAAPSVQDGETNQAEGPDPIGSDLWLEEFVDADARITKMNVPDSISVIIASDGTQSAPRDVDIVWPKAATTPWSGPLIAGGGILLIVGLILYILAIRAMRRARGPRRKGPKMPKLPKPTKYKPTKAIEQSKKGRRSTRHFVVAVPTVLIGALMLSGCSAKYWPDFGGQSTPTQSGTPIATDLPGQGKEMPPPAVTTPQLNDIVNRISAVATEADTKSDAKLTKSRFTGPALNERVANYKIRTKKKIPASPAIPEDSIVVGLPQATDSWPRVVTAEVHDASKEKTAPQYLVMVQQTPRENYKVEYAITLQAKATVPDLAPANIGTSMFPPDSKLLLMAPSEVGAAYGDILMHGDKSTFVDMFDATSDGLSKQVGAAFKAKQIKDLPKTAKLSYASGPGVGTPIAMATNDSGAIISTNITETATVKPVQDGAKVGAGDVTAALTGVSESTKGLSTTYGYQLLFYVPPADSNEKIRLLGFTQAPISAKELK